MDEDRFEKTAAKQTLARGSANTPLKFAMTAARLKGGFGGTGRLRNDQNASSDTASENVPRMAKTRAPAEQVADHAGNGGAESHWR